MGLASALGSLKVSEGILSPLKRKPTVLLGKQRALEKKIMISLKFGSGWSAKRMRKSRYTIKCTILTISFARLTTGYLPAPVVHAQMQIAIHAIMAWPMMRTPMLIWPMMQWASLFSSDLPHSCLSVTSAEISPFKSDSNVSIRCFMIVVTE